MERWVERLDGISIMLLSYARWVHSDDSNSDNILDDKIERAARYAERFPELAGHYVRKQRFFEAFRRDVYDEHAVAAETERVTALLEDMSAAVDDSDYLTADYSFADAIATSILYRLIDIATLDGWNDGQSALSRYMERLKARPSYRAVFVDDPLLTAM